MTNLTSSRQKAGAALLTQKELVMQEERVEHAWPPSPPPHSVEALVVAVKWSSWHRSHWGTVHSTYLQSSMMVAAFSSALTCGTLWASLAWSLALQLSL